MTPPQNSGDKDEHHRQKGTDKSTGLKGPKSAQADVHDLDDYMKGGYFLEDLDIE